MHSDSTPDIDGEFGQLVPSVSIENMVNQRAAVVTLLTEACAKINEAAALARVGHLGMPRFMLSNGFSRNGEVTLNPARLGADRRGARYEPDASADADVLAAIVRGVDAAAWQYLMGESGLRSLMDAEARRRWDESIASGAFPELTFANVRATFEQLHGARGDMFERGVIACFKDLSWAYKTNQPQKFGKRLVLTYVRSAVSGGGGRWAASATSLGSVDLKRSDRLDDLARVLHILDGKPQPDHRHGWYRRLADCRSTQDPHPSDGYLSVRCFRNGNGHVTFLRGDLIDKMNRILAKHYPGALPAPK